MTIYALKPLAESSICVHYNRKMYAEPENLTLIAPTSKTKGLCFPPFSFSVKGVLNNVKLMYVLLPKRRLARRIAKNNVWYFYGFEYSQLLAWLYVIVINQLWHSHL